MGAESFVTKSKGKTAQEAFRAAVQEAQYEHGHGGYTGTIAEKEKFLELVLPPNTDAKVLARTMVNGQHPDSPLIDNKWGPCGCFKLAEGEYLFFGWASS